MLKIKNKSPFFLALSACKLQKAEVEKECRALQKITQFERGVNYSE